MHSLTSTAHTVLAAGVGSCNPSNSGMPGGQAFSKIIPWAMWTALALCVLGAIGSGGAMAIGSLGRNPHLS